MEVLFEYAAADYRSIIYTERPKLCREVEHHLSKAGVSTEPELEWWFYLIRSVNASREAATMETHGFFCTV